ncbi:hypothetical protein B0H13DRAFT_1852356 [Mycena leptocephala]|nr:hypothetical protein B0H13DRAFT_1852356 [Mycena leptocephala]
MARAQQVSMTQCMSEQIRMTRNQSAAVSHFCAAPLVVVAAMEALPESLRIPEATANACLPPDDLPVLKLIKFNLPPLHKSTAFLNPTDYLLEYAPTLTAFDPASIPTSGRFALSLGDL